MRTLRPHVLALLVALAITATAAHAAPAATKRAVQPDGSAVKAIRHYRATTLSLQRVMGHQVRFRRLHRVSLEHARKVWRRRAVSTRRRFLQGPPHKGAWLCIHDYEGSWSDGGSPYYGGLQMDISFQASYGGPLLSRKGTAENWTPLEQMWVAERAYRSGRGFYPWPNTARACGLI
jgi:hypothetical protein